MSKKIKSLFTYLTSFITKGESSPKNEQKPQPAPQKNVFGGDSPLPALTYAKMIMFLDHHYRESSDKQGHINYNEMKKRLSKMSHQEVAMLFDAVIELRALHREYIVDAEVEEEKIDES